MNLGHILFGYSGRINRGKFWLGVGAIILVSILATIIGGLMGSLLFSIGPPLKGSTDPNIVITPLGWAAYAALILFSIYTSFAIYVKRCHDRNKSGWWSLLALIPLIGAIWVIVELGILEGTKGDNQYGPDPLHRS